MAYHSAEDMEKLLAGHPQYREKLYCRGFLITNGTAGDLAAYPFYGNWHERELADGYRLYLHKDAHAYLYRDEETLFFLVGHAYDPFSMKWEEDELLQDLAAAKRQGSSAFWEAESALTGVFCLGYVEAGRIVYATDCCGMQLCYSGVAGGSFVLTSHSKLCEDLFALSRDPYVDKLVADRFYHYWGTWLPGDLSPYPALKRLQPNFFAAYGPGSTAPSLTRFYPLRKIEETATEEEYRQTIRELGDVMAATMRCIAEKWKGQDVALSVTGGRDSMTAFSCANGIYDRFRYFSYISNPPEAVDAYAARDICSYVGVPHTIYEIPADDAQFPELDVFKKILECNAGCIGENNPNDARKRLYFSAHPPFDVEIKSWVNEMGRAFYYGKYNKKKFPRRPTASYLRAMHKVYLTPYLIRETDRVFRDYIDRYFGEDVLDKLSWLDLYMWEFSWSGGEGVFLTSEQRVCYDITVPFNNRKYVEKLLTVPLKKRIADDTPRDMIAARNPRVSECGIVIKDVKHTGLRSLLVRAYLETFSRIRL